jgi:hypothetical protein
MKKILGFVLVFTAVIIVLRMLDPNPKPSTEEPKAKVLDYGPEIPASSLSDPTLANAPTLHNDGESNCTGENHNLHPCTDQEIAEAQVELQRQWNSEPEWLRRMCVSFTTLKSITNCEVTETVKYLNTHPGEKAPWTGIVP